MVEGAFPLFSSCAVLGPNSILANTPVFLCHHRVTEVEMAAMDGGVKRVVFSPPSYSLSLAVCRPHHIVPISFKTLRDLSKAHQLRGARDARHIWSCSPMRQLVAAMCWPKTCLHYHSWNRNKVSHRVSLLPRRPHLRLTVIALPHLLHLPLCIKIYHGMFMKICIVSHIQPGHLRNVQQANLMLVTACPMLWIAISRCYRSHML